MIITRKFDSVVAVALFAIAAGFLISEPLFGQQDLSYETIRFYTKNSKPESVQSYAISPNGRFLALSFDSRLGSRSGVSIVDLDKKELVRTTGNFSFFTMAFSSDSTQLLGVGGYAGIQMIDVGTGTVHSYRNKRDPYGKIGLNIGEKNGKLLVTRITDGFNPTVGDHIKIGDEVLAINQGETPTRFTEYRGWTSLTGKSRNKALQLMAGMPGTWIQLRLARRGSGKPIEVCVQRQWPNGVQQKFPKTGASLTQAVGRHAFQFRSADTLEISGYAGLRDIQEAGQHAISPDAKRFAAVSLVRGKNEIGVEVHSLKSGNVENSAELKARNYRHIRFSPDSNKVLVGTRDTVEILDVESGEWESPVVLTPPDESDGGRVVRRRIPLGFGLPGDLYTTTRSVVYSKPAALELFAVAPNGSLAIASETGEIVLADLESKERTGLIGDQILGARPELIDFSPTGDRLVAFAKGVLHIIDVDGQHKQEVAKTDR